MALKTSLKFYARVFDRPKSTDSPTALENQPTHTPGPWRVDRTGPNDAAIRSKHFHVALVTSGLDDDEVNQPIFTANAHLIAAAPDLLAVVRAVAAHFDGTDAPLGAAARAAVLKAEGR